jgi:hypothetical protein
MTLDKDIAYIIELNNYIKKCVYKVLKDEGIRWMLGQDIDKYKTSDNVLILINLRSRWLLMHAPNMEYAQLYIKKDYGKEYKTYDPLKELRDKKINNII